MKVLVSDDLSERGVEILKKGGLTVDVKTKLSPEELIKEIGRYEGLVIRSTTKVAADLIEAAKKLKVIGRAGSGLDNVDLPAATKKGIVVMNTPGGNTITTAEHAIALMFALARHIPQANASVKAGKWEKKKFMGTEVYNKTLGVIGIGSIGSQVVKKAKGLGMNVLAFDPYLSPERARDMGAKLVDLSELFRRSDFITIHAPFTEETKNLIDAKAIEQMKDGVRIINTARGGIVNEKDLYDALLKGKVAGAAFDVFEKEPPGDSSLLGLDNFICTPHLGASTAEAQENVAISIAEQIVDYLIKGVASNAVNIPSIPPELLVKIQPYTLLAERLGSLLCQLYEGRLERISIEYRGEVSDYDVTPITVSLLKGLLTPILGDSVNFVNAPLIAKDRKIEVMESKCREVENYISLITLTAESGKKRGAISGTLYNRRDPRIVEIDGFSIEAIPEGVMLILENIDKPGVIGGIGTLLGDNGINIARMAFGREKPGGKAISVIGIDTPATAEILSKIKKLPNVLSVKQVRL